MSRDIHTNEYTYVFIHMVYMYLYINICRLHFICRYTYTYIPNVEVVIHIKTHQLTDGEMHEFIGTCKNMCINEPIKLPSVEKFILIKISSPTEYMPDGDRNCSEVM